MTIPYERISKKIYDILAGSYNVEMFDSQSNKTYDTELARKFFIVPGNSMISIHNSDDDEKAKIAVSLSPDVNIETFEKNIGRNLKLIARKHGQNMGYSIRKFGHELQPRDFAHQLEEQVKEESTMVNKTVSEAKIAMTGTTRSSYQRVGECRVIIRHTDRVNEDKFGARSRNINAIFVETKNGERFKVAENNLHGARAMARHLSNGGSPFDTVGMKVSSMMEEMSTLKKMMAEVKNVSKGEQLVEQGGELAGKIRTRFIGLRETLRKMSGKVGYFRQTSDLTENSKLDEYTYDTHSDPESGTDAGPKVPKAYGSPAQELVFKMQDALSPPSQLRPEEANIWSRASENLGNALADPGNYKLSNDDMRVLYDAANTLGINLRQTSSEGIELSEFELPDGGKFQYILNQYGFRLQGGGPVAGKARYISNTHQVDIQMHHDMKRILGWVLYEKTNRGLNKINTGTDEKLLNGILGRLGESIQEDKNVDGETNVEEKSVDAKTKPKKDEVPNMVQEPGFDRPIRKAKNHFVNQDLVRDNPEGLHSVNYYKEGIAPEETMLEEYFNEMSDVEFFKEEELIIEKDKAPEVEKILPETAFYTLNSYIGHPLFDKYVGLYEEQKLFDDILNLVEVDSKLWNTIVESRERLEELGFDAPIPGSTTELDPQVIEDAIEKLKILKRDRRTGMDDAIDKISQEIAEGHLDGTSESREVVAKQLRKRAEEEGLIDHDDGGSFADDALSNNEVISGHKNEIEAEQYYEPAKFESDDEYGDHDGPPKDIEPCKKCGEEHYGPCPLYDAESGLRQISEPEIQAIWAESDMEVQRQMSMELIKDFHFKDEASRRHEMNKLNSLRSKNDFDRWASNMMLHGEGLGQGYGRGPRRRESIEQNSELARISELAGIEKNDEVDETASSEKKKGRRQAGSYGRPGSKKQKQAASKSGRVQAGKDVKDRQRQESFDSSGDIEEDFSTFIGLTDVNTSSHGPYGRKMKPLPERPEEEENFNARIESIITDEPEIVEDFRDTVTLDKMPLLLKQAQTESKTEESEIDETFSDEVTLDNMPRLLNHTPEEPQGEPELSEDGARIIQLARYRN